MDDADREAILARRRRFVALALAGSTAASACASPCLSPDAGIVYSPDAGVASDAPDAADDTGGSDGGEP